MPFEHRGKKEDKRLLVLLALGALFLFPHLHHPEGHCPESSEHYCWLRLDGAGENLYRFPDSFSSGQFHTWVENTVHKPLDETVLRRCFRSGVIELNLNINSADSETRCSPSPRLAMFLGRPFSINHADEKELIMLPGIGPHLARKIIAYRDQHGDFKSDEMLLNVKGIGPRQLSRLTPLLSFN